MASEWVNKGVDLGLTCSKAHLSACTLSVFAENSEDLFRHKTILSVLGGCEENLDTEAQSILSIIHGVDDQIMFFLLCRHLPTFCPQGSQKELLNLTQQDYVNRIEELNQSLKDAWASDQKVKALKIVIQVRSSDFFFSFSPRISYVKLLL